MKLLFRILCVFAFLSVVLSISNSSGNGGIDNDIEDTDTDLINSYLESQKELNKTNITNKTEVCQCVKYYLCNSTDFQHGGNNGTTDGGGGNDTSPVPDSDGVSSGDILGIVDIRQGLGNSNLSANGCPHYLDVCCKHVKKEKNPPVGPEDPKVIIQNLTNWVHKDCGHRNKNGIGFKITGTTGKESQFGEFSWTAAVVQQELVEVDTPDGKKENATRNVFLCGGSLLHPQVVLTAAHCVFEIANSENRKHLYVRLGEWDTQTTDEPFPHQDRFVKKVVMHEQLYRKGLYNDVALLFLETPVKLAPNVDTICLPPMGTSASEFDGQSCFSSGWGKDNFGVEGRYQEIMKKVEVPIIPKQKCESELRKTRLTDNFRLHESFICAGDALHDDCTGDGGSPLICKLLNSPNYVQVGIVAWGIGCLTSTPAVYVNVVKFSPWILNKMKEHHFDTKYCTV